jgi:hypothetical protein
MEEEGIRPPVVRTAFENINGRTYTCNDLEIEVYVTIDMRTNKS